MTRSTRPTRSPGRRPLHALEHAHGDPVAREGDAGVLRGDLHGGFPRGRLVDRVAGTLGNDKGRPACAKLDPAGDLGQIAGGGKGFLLRPSGRLAPSSSHLWLASSKPRRLI